MILLESEHLHSSEGPLGERGGNFPKHPNLQQRMQMASLVPGPGVSCQLALWNPLLSFLGWTLKLNMKP